MKPLSQIFKPLSIAIFYIVFLVVPHYSNCQSTKGDFETLLDSLKQMREDGKIEQAIQFGKNLLANETFKRYDELQMETHHVMVRVYSQTARIDEIKSHANQIIDIAKSIGDHRWQHRATESIALGFFEVSQYDSAQIYFEKCLTIAKANLPDRHPFALSQLGWIYGLTDQEEKELNAYIELLKVVDNNPELDKNGRLRSKALGALGDYHSRHSQYEKARDYYERKLQIADDNNIPLARFEANLGLGSLYSQDDYFDLSKSEEAYLVAAEDTTTFLMVRVMGQLGLGSLYSKAELYDKSMQAFNAAYDVVKTTSAEDFLARIETEIANIHLRKNELTLANESINKALERVKRKNLTNRERNALRVRYKIDSARSDYRAAFNNYLGFRAIEDSLKTEDSKKRLQELEVKFETEQTENQNLILKNDLAIKEADLRQRAIVQLVFAIVAFLLAVLAYVIYKGDRRKKKLNLTLKHKNELISIQKEELQFKTDKLQIINSQLKALSDFRKDLTRMIAHDMKNPLNSIIGLSSTLEKDGKVNNITKSGYQLLDLVTNMLEVEKLEEIKIEPKKQQIPLDELVKYAREQVELLVAAKSIIFQNLLPKKLTIQADKHLMVRVFVNLLTNAIKYSNNGDTIKIYHRHDGDNVLITVEDKGVGISSERLPYIFDKFWQGEQRKSGLATSNGLGLTYCRLAVEAHGGIIEVESSPGEGTRVTFSLPYSGEKLSPLKEVKPSRLDLIIEEELIQLQSYWPELEKLAVYEVSKVKEILKRMEDENLKSLWLGEILRAVYQGDTTYFNELIQAVRPLASI